MDSRDHPCGYCGTSSASYRTVREAMMDKVTMEMIGQLVRRFNIDEWLFMVKLAGSHDAAFVLRKLIRWNETSTAQERGGEFYKTHAEMSEETGGLSPYRIRKAQKLITRFVRIDKRRHKGRDWTWYCIDEGALLAGIGKVLAIMTGKIFDLAKGIIGEERVKNLRRSGLKNLSRQTLTNSKKDQSDDDVIDLPPAFRKFAFKGLRDDARLLKEIERIGEEQALVVLERCIKFGGKRWGYVWTALEGEEPGAVKAELQRRKDAKTQRHANDEVPVMSLIDSEFDLEAWRAERAAERERNKPWAEKQEAIAPASEAVDDVVRQDTGWTLRKAIEVAWHQLQLQFDRATFDTWLRDVRVVDYQDNTVVLHVPNQYAEEKINKWLYRNIRRVISDVLNRQTELRAVSNWGAV